VYEVLPPSTVDLAGKIQIYSYSSTSLYRKRHLTLLFTSHSKQTNRQTNNSSAAHIFISIIQHQNSSMHTSSQGTNHMAHLAFTRNALSPIYWILWPWLGRMCISASLEFGTEGQGKGKLVINRIISPSPRHPSDLWFCCLSYPIYGRKYSILE
jgi:hypothetical protein